MRVKSRGDLDLFIAGCYAYIERDDKGAKLWDHVSTALASVRARTTIVMASDFNGHVESGRGPNGPPPSAEQQYQRSETDRCEHNSQLDPREHVESQRGGADGMGWGTARRRTARWTTRNNHFVVSDHAFDEVEVKAQLKVAKRLRLGGVKPGKKSLTTSPSPWYTDTSCLSTHRDKAKP